MPKRAWKVTAAQAEATLSRRAPTPTSLPCLNPRCSNDCEWTTTEGRPALFCRAVCRAAWNKDRDRYIRDLALVEAALADPLVKKEQARRLRSQAAQLRWVMARYRADESGGITPWRKTGRAAGGSRL